ncbi:MAG: uracil-DNA glycosylase family protein [Cyclobacteriaceae bacterium]
MKSFQELRKRLDPKRQISCKSCGLYLNQYPVRDKIKSGGVFWVGLSAVKFGEGSKRLPLSSDTRSGELISNIEAPFEGRISFYKTNLVKCLPLNNSTGKIRYPLKKEMGKCFPNLQAEIDGLNPKIIFLLGRQVTSFVLSQYSIDESKAQIIFNYPSYSYGELRFVPIHHPSYVLVYKRKYISNYISAVREHLSNLESSYKSLHDSILLTTVAAQDS